MFHFSFFTLICSLESSPGLGCNLRSQIIQGKQNGMQHSFLSGLVFLTRVDASLMGTKVKVESQATSQSWNDSHFLLPVLICQDFMLTQSLGGKSSSRYTRDPPLSSALSPPNHFISSHGGGEGRRVRKSV